MAAPTDVVRRPEPRPPTRSRHRKRPRWLTWLLNTLIALLAMAVVVTGLGYVYLRNKLADIRRVDIPTLADDLPGSVMNVLLVGSDTRSNISENLKIITGSESVGDRDGLSDTMMILHIDPQQGQAAILSIPRDLWITVSGSKDRINSAFAIGGPQLLIDTIQQSLGIAINHYVEVDLEGFKNIVDTVGGLKVYLEAPARDDYSGLDLPEAGCVTLDGYQALAYVRSRHYMSYEAGYWNTDASSDLGRIQRQQDFVRRMMRKALSSGLSNPLTLNRLISIGVNNLTIDSAMSTKDIVNLARRFRSLDPDSVDMQTLPTERWITPGGADVQLLLQTEAQPLIDKINGRAPLAPSAIRPGDVSVRVLNGFGGTGAASTVAFALQNAGFAVPGTPGDADAFTYDKTAVRYAPGKEDKAKLVQSYLAAGAILEEDSTLGTVDLALIVGADYAGVRPAPAGPDASPGTTLAPQTPTPEARGSKSPAC
ncbi:MAG: LCP family protein [Acidimicrobiales bacterium]